jgi:anaerobic magnesium-protoporphyrin IX monomethyl ester cyclase
MVIIQSLRAAGYDLAFYHIDALRPSFQEVVQFFKDQAPDVVGISAVVSTAYAYSKDLAAGVREASLKTKIVAGATWPPAPRFCSGSAKWTCAFPLNPRT